MGVARSETPTIGLSTFIEAGPLVLKKTLEAALKYQAIAYIVFGKNPGLRQVVENLFGLKAINLFPKQPHSV